MGYLKRKRPLENRNDQINGDRMDSRAVAPGAVEDAYRDLMGVDQADKDAIVDKRMAVANVGAAGKERLQIDEENDYAGWRRGSVRPPNKMMIKLKYRDEWTIQPVVTATVTNTFQQYILNSLFTPNYNNSVNTGHIVAEPFPFLLAYTGFWNRALVMNFNFDVTFINLSPTQVLRAFVGFQPYDQTFTTGTWATLEAQVNSDANKRWVHSVSLAPSTLPESQVTLKFSKYLPDIYGDVDAYTSTLDNLSGGLATGADFTQPFPSAAGWGNNLTLNPADSLYGIVGMMNTANANITFNAYQYVRATMTTMFFRSILQWT